MEIIAHRGASALAPENSLEAVRLALRLGAKAIEIDVHLTADNVVVLSHNGSVVSLKGVPLEIGSISYKELEEEARLSNGEHIPALEEILQVINKQIKLYIEMVEKRNRCATEVCSRCSQSFHRFP